jgi:hypothetical protein
MSLDLSPSSGSSTNGSFPFTAISIVIKNGKAGKLKTIKLIIKRILRMGLILFVLVVD